MKETAYLGLNARMLASASLAVVLFAVQFAAIRFAPSDSVIRIVLPLTIAFVPLALWPYRAYIGVWVLFVGLAANLAAILANGGLMPIDHATVVDVLGEEHAAEHAVGDWIPGSKDVVVESDGPLLALGDGIVVDFGRGGMVVSPGDLVIWSGLLILAAEVSIGWQRRKRRYPAAAPESAAAERGATT